MILGPFLFNILLCDLFLTINNTNSATHADDNTPYTPGENIDDVIGRLEETATVMLRWFTENQMKSNAEKFHLILDWKRFKSWNRLFLGEIFKMTINMESRVMTLERELSKKSDIIECSSDQLIYVKLFSHQIK